MEIRECPLTVSIEGLRHDSAEIERKFLKLVASIYKSLTSRNISKDRLVACLTWLNCLTKVYNGGNQSMFRKQRRKFEDPSATLDTVWNIVGEYFSFFDYDILETIVDTLGDDSDKHNFARYEENFVAYASRRLVIDKSSSCNDCESNGENATMLVVLDSSYDECEIGHLKRLQIKLSEVLNLNKGILQLCKVKEGSVQLVFRIPNFITKDIFPLSSDQESALGELGVTQLDCGDYHFRTKV